MISLHPSQTSLAKKIKAAILKRKSAILLADPGRGKTRTIGAALDFLDKDEVGTTVNVIVAQYAKQAKAQSDEFGTEKKAWVGVLTHGKRNG